jgi:radical SAM protein with 4Fe4S-binding SPASM domain
VNGQGGHGHRTPGTASGEGGGLRQRLRALAHERRIPLRAEIELTRRCNLRCRHCYLPPAGEARPEMAVHEVVRLLAELRGLGCISVILTGGEVLLLGEGFFTVAEAVRANDMVLSVITNGTLWDQGTAERLARLGASAVTVSLYAADAARHDAVTGVPGSFARTVAGGRALVAAGVRCHVSSLLMVDTIDGFRAVRDFASGLGCEVSFDPTVAPRCDGSLDVLRYRVPGERLLEFYRDEWVLPRTREGALVSSATEEVGQPGPVEKRNCGAGFTSVFVDAHGDVLPCMGFPPPFGNVRSRPFAAVWRGAVAERQRRLLEEPLEECRACEVAAFCTTRCPRLALVEDGDVNGASRRACEMTSTVLRLRAMVRESASPVGERPLTLAATRAGE